MKRIKHNDLVPWFIMDHGTLPAGYLRACKKFFMAGREDAEMYKRQAISLKLQARENTIYEENEKLIDRSPKPQAPSCKLDSWPDPCYRIIKDK